jgi:hypothetical protein
MISDILTSLEHGLLRDSTMQGARKLIGVLVVLCGMGAAVQAATFSIQGPGRDWNNIADWRQDSAAATRVPGASDYTDVIYSTAANPTRIQAADAATRYLYLSLYNSTGSDGISGGALKLTDGYDLSAYRILYGGSTDNANVNAGADSLLDIGAGSMVTCSSYFGNYIAKVNTLSEAWVQRINVRGTLETPTFNLNDGVFNISLEGGGTLKVTTDVIVTLSSAAAKINFTSDLASMVMKSGDFDELLSANILRVNDVTATAADFQTADAGSGLTKYMLAPVPEPSAMALLGLGAALAVLRRKH